MNKDLFGNKITVKKRKSRLENSLEKNDKISFNDRLQRLKYLNNIFPKYSALSGDIETIYLYTESKIAFINGEFISTILLCQSLIERKLQEHFSSLGLDKIAKRELKAIIEYSRKNEILSDYLIENINILRKKRNPFTHIKPSDYEFNMSQRMYDYYSRLKTIKQPWEILESDAKQAISLMLTVLCTELKNIKEST